MIMSVGRYKKLPSMYKYYSIVTFLAKYIASSNT